MPPYHEMIEISRKKCYATEDKPKTEYRYYIILPIVKLQLGRLKIYWRAYFYRLFSNDKER